MGDLVVWETDCWELSSDQGVGRPIRVLKKADEPPPPPWGQKRRVTPPPLGPKVFGRNGGVFKKILGFCVFFAFHETHFSEKKFGSIFF